MARRSLVMISVLVVATGMLGGCSGGDDDGGGSGDTAPTVAVPSDAVCDGTGNPAAPAMTESGNTVYIYVNDGSGWSYQSWFSDLPGGAEPLNPDEASLVVCLEVTGTSTTVTCPFEDEGDAFTLEVAEATYDATLRASSTGEVVETITTASEAPECPLSAFWTQGEGTRTDYAKPVDDVLAMLEPYL